MRSQGISQFYLHTPRSSANGMNHTCLCLPSRSWYTHLPTQDGWKAELSLGGYRNVSGTGNWTQDTVAYLMCSVVVWIVCSWCPVATDTV